MLFALLPLDQAFPEKHIHIRQLDSTAVGAGQPPCWTRGGEAVLDEQNIVMKEICCESYSDLRAVSCPSPCLHLLEELNDHLRHVAWHSMDAF